MNILHLVILLSGLILAAHAMAHDLWLERQADSYVLYQGHRHSSHAGAELVPYSADFVHRVNCAQTDGSNKTLAAAADYPMRFQASCAALVVAASSGVWSKTVYGIQHQPPAGLSNVIHSWRSHESVKRLDAWSEALTEPLGEALELVPINDPFALQEGDKLRLLVTYQGKPRGGVSVAYDDDVRGLTGADGRINLRIRHPGMQMISASFNEADSEPGVDQAVHTAVLHFELAEAPTR